MAEDVVSGGVLIFLVCFSVFLGHSAASNNLPCPNFDCKLGTYVNGKFVEHGNILGKAAFSKQGGVLKKYFFDLNDFADSFPSITDGELTDANLACAEACMYLYNDDAAANGWLIAVYWMFEQTCDYGPGGQCICMSDFACDTPRQVTGWWSDEYIEDFKTGLDFNVPTTYTTGSVCSSDIVGDPHFTGADGSHFEFSGVPNRTFAVVSDAHIQINAYLGGRWGQWDDRVKAMTWIRQVAVMWGHHVAVFSARVGASADYGLGYMDMITVDGDLLDVPPHGTTTAADGHISVSWTEVKKRSGGDFVDTYQVAVGSSLKFRLLLRPEVRHLRTKDDGVVHFTIMIDRAQLSTNVHGILGQTYRPDFAGRLSSQRLIYSELLGTEVVPGDNAEGFIDGEVDDYLVHDLFKADCRFCRFARGTSVDEETARALAMSSGTSQAFSSRRLLGESR